MPDSGGQVHEVILLDRHLLVAVQQGRTAILDKVHLLLGGVADNGRGPAGTDREFAVPGDTLEMIGILVANAEQGLVGSQLGIRREIVRLRPDIGYLAAQEDRVRREQTSRGGEKHDCQSFEASHNFLAGVYQLAILVEVRIGTAGPEFVNNDTCRTGEWARSTPVFARCALHTSSFSSTPIPGVSGT